MSSSEDTRARPTRAKSTDVARWGAACASCAAAKAKCSRSSTAPTSKCDRCERLLKHCTDQVHQPRRRRQRKHTVDANRRLYGLLEALGERTNRSTSPSDFSSDLSCASSALDFLYPQDTPHTHRPPIQTPLGMGGPGTVLIPSTYLSYAPPGCISQPHSSTCPIPMESDDTLLGIFRNELTPLYPFVMIPAYMTASVLQHSRPFTMSAIRLVAGLKDLNCMRGQLFQVLNHIADHMLLRAERSIDLLMGIVVLLGWYHYHCIRHSQHNNLICLAQSLVADLGLNRTPFAAGCGAPERSNEERRLLLAVWYLTSSTGIHRLQIDTMRYTPYMEQCARDLLSSNEYPSDEVLANCVLIQQLTEKIWRHASPDYGTVNGIEPQQGTEAQAYTTMLGAQLDNMIEHMPLYLKSNAVIISHINTATLRLHEAHLIRAAKQVQVPGGFSLLDPASLSTFQDHFNRSTTVLKDWWEFWLAIPATQYTRYPTPIFFHLIHGVAILNHWATVAVLHGFDDSNDTLDPPDAVRDRMDALGLGSSMLDFLHAFSDKCREASQSLAGAPGVEPDAWDNNIWQLSERKSRSCRAMLVKLASTFGHAPNSIDVHDSDSRDEFGRQGYASEVHGHHVLESPSYESAARSISGQPYPLNHVDVTEQWSWGSEWSASMGPSDPHTWYGSNDATQLAWPGDAQQASDLRNLPP